MAKALPVGEASDLDAARAYESVVEHLMFDAKPAKDAALPGGVGRAFDWALMDGRRFQRPWFLAGGLDPWNVQEAASVAGAPPALVVTAEYDPLRDEGEAYGARLEALGVPVTVSRYDGVIHGFFAMRDLVPEGKAATEEACAALRAALA